MSQSHTTAFAIWWQVKEFYAPPLDMYRRMAEEKMMGGLLPRLLAWSADAKLGVAMRRERQAGAIIRMVGPGLVVMGASAHAVPRGRASVRSANVHSTLGVRCGGSTPRASRSWCSRRTSTGGSRIRTGRRSRRCALSPSLSSSRRRRAIGVFFGGAHARVCARRMRMRNHSPS